MLPSCRARAGGGTGSRRVHHTASWQAAPQPPCRDAPPVGHASHLHDGVRREGSTCAVDVGDRPVVLPVATPQLGFPGRLREAGVHVVQSETEAEEAVEARDRLHRPAEVSSLEPGDPALRHASELGELALAQGAHAPHMT